MVPPHLFLQLSIEFFPAPVYGEALWVRLMHHRQPTLIPRFAEFAIEAPEGNIFAVVLVKRGIVFALRDEDDAVRAAIIHRCQTHGAGMRQNVELASREMLRLQPGRCLPDRADLGMGRGVVGLRHQIDAFGQDRCVFNDEAGKWTASGLHVPPCQFYRLLTEVHGDLPVRDTRSDTLGGNICPRMRGLRGVYGKAGGRSIPPEGRHWVVRSGTARMMPAGPRRAAHRLLFHQTNDRSVTVTGNSPHLIPCCFRSRRAIKSYSIVWCNLADI